MGNPTASHPLVKTFVDKDDHALCRASTASSHPD